MNKIASFYFGKSFFEQLAHYLVGQKSKKKMNRCCKNDAVIFLPTNRSILNLKKKVIELSVHANKTVIVPRMISLSDIAEMELFLNQYDENFTPQKTISNLEKFLSLFSKLKNIDPIKRKVEWTQYFCQFEDACAIAEISIEKVQHYVLNDYIFSDGNPKEFEAFKNVFQIFCDFMKELRGQNLQTQTTYRSFLCRRIADIIQEKFKGRVIVAGTTGTIPATRDLIQAVLEHDEGYLFLPGLFVPDQHLASQELTHPLYTMAQLVKDLKIETQFETGDLNERGKLIYQCYQESSSHINMNQASKNLFLHSFDTLQDEAYSIVKIVHKLLVETTYDISIVTSNTQLMALLHSEFDLNSIKANFSSGMAFQHSPVGQYLSLLLDIIQKPLDSKLWLYLLKHPLFLKERRYEVLKIVRLCELYLRTKVEFGKKTILEVFHVLSQSLKVDVNVFENEILEDVKCRIKEIEHLHTLLDGEESFTNFLDALKQVLNTSTHNAAFQSYDGKCLTDFFDILKQNIRCMKSKNFIAYVKELMVIAPSVEDPSVYGSRVRILGALESRSNIAEVVICASQNEGSWPREPDIDPFINLSTKLLLGFPHPKRQQGLAAHDWCSNMYGEIVILTRSKVELGQSKLHNRYWQRLLDLGVCESDYGLVWGEYASDPQKDIVPIAPPSPKPLLNLRPKKYSASQLHLLINDPYSFYVAYILKLNPLKQLDERLMFIEKGVIFHKIFEDFLKIENFQEQTLDNLLSMANLEFNKVCFEEAPLARIIWLERFRFIAEVFYEKLELEPVIFRKLESIAQHLINVNDLDIEIHARFDRLEILKDSCKNRIIDYKTGWLPTLSDIYSGKAIQILLQTFLADHHNLSLKKDLDDVTIAELWQLQGTKEEPIKILSLSVNCEQKKEVLNGIHNLLSFFLNSNNPYLSCPSYDQEIYFSRKEEWQHQLRD